MVLYMFKRSPGLGLEPGISLMAADERRDAESWVNRDLVDAAEAGRDLFIFNGSETAAVDKHTHMCACIE